MGLSLGGAAAARLSDQMGYRHSRNTILQVIASLPLPDLPTLKISSSAESSTQLKVNDVPFAQPHYSSKDSWAISLPSSGTRIPIGLYPFQNSTLAN
jgi:hypothetical protein